MIRKWLKSLFSDMQSAIVSIVVAALLTGTGSIYLFYRNLWNSLMSHMLLQTPLWATITLVLVVLAYTYLKIRKIQIPLNPPTIQEELHEAFGVYWNNLYKLRCLKCKWPLKCASKAFDSSIFFCSNCNNKHTLRDLNGIHMTEAKAIEQLKIFPTSH